MLHAEEDTTEIDIDDSVPLFLVVVRGRRRLSRLNPRIVEGGIEPAEDFHRLVQSRLHLVSAPYIAPDGEGAPALLLDQARCFLVALVGNIGDDDVRALPRKRQRRRSTDAARPAGDECDLACETIPLGIHVFLSPPMAAAAF
jgi:hypothetical protein